MSDGPMYSVVVPTYDSAGRLDDLVHRVEEAMDGRSFELILVNDGSRDATWSDLVRIHDERGHVVVDLQQNAGQHLATLCGLRLARGDVMITIDDDLQTPPDEIVALIEAAEREEADLVYGVYPEKRHSAVRNLGSRILTGLLHRYASAPPRGSSFRLVQRELVDRLADNRHAFVYLDELFGWYARRTVFVPVEHRKRAEGRSGYGFWSLLKLTHAILVNYTILPLRIITFIGLLSSVASFITAIVFIIRKITVGAEMGFTSIIVSIFFSTGLILLSLGTIGEYLSRIFLMQSDKPAYRINEVRS